jgi:hypothetical protein
VPEFKQESANHTAFTQNHGEDRSLQGPTTITALTALTALASFLAVVVSAINVWQTTNANRRSQRDSQMNETLRRLGDVGSVPARASAAFALSQLALKEKPWWRTKGNRYSRSRSEFYVAAVLQFCTALQLEEDRDVTDALEQGSYC